MVARQVLQVQEKFPARVQLAGEAERSSRFERPGEMQHAILGGCLAMPDFEEAKAEVRQRPAEATRQIAAALIWQRHATSAERWIQRHAFHRPEFGSCCLFARYVIFGENQFARFGQGPARNRTLQGYSYQSYLVAIRHLLLLYSPCEIEQRDFKVAYQRSFTH